MNKNLRMIKGIFAYYFKRIFCAKLNYSSLKYNAKIRAESKQFERVMHMRSLCGK